MISIPPIYNPWQNVCPPYIMSVPPYIMSVPPIMIYVPTYNNVRPPLNAWYKPLIYYVRPPLHDVRLFYMMSVTWCLSTFTWLCPPSSYICHVPTCIRLFPIIFLFKFLRQNLGRTPAQPHQSHQLKWCPHTFEQKELKSLWVSSFISADISSRIFVKIQR